MALDPQLLEILACPDDKGPLLYFEDEDSLYNPRLKRRYAIKDDIPIMLIDEAETRGRRRARPLARQGRRAGHQPHLRRVGRDVSGLLDTVGMFDLAAGLPEQVAAAADLGAAVDGLPEHEAIEHVVVLGMGGSGVAGDVLAAVAGPFMPVPVTVVKGYEAPPSVGEGTLCFAISYSGNTEETVEAAQAAAAAGARMVLLSTGGELARLAAGWDAPHVALPDCPMPRAGIGSVSIPPLVMLERIGLFPGASEYVADAVRQLQRRRDRLIVDGGPAQQLARAIGPTMPIAYGGDALGGRGGLPLQVPGERERQGAGVLRRAPRDGPQRDLRVGPARRRRPAR